jgi:RHS repeat-associated protein
MKRIAYAAILALGISAPAFAQKQPVAPTYANLPMNFEQNVGQTDGQAQFISHGKGYTLFLSTNQAILKLHATSPSAMSSADEKKLGRRFFAERARKATRQTAAVRMKLLGANPGAQLVGMDKLSGTANYFIGGDSSKWQTGVPLFAKVQSSDVFPGVDLVYYGNEKRLEYDFVVKPGADPNAISLGFDGIQGTSLDKSGNLSMTTDIGGMNLNKPVVYQMIGGQRKEVAGKYALRGANAVGFEVTDYDKTQPLIIDPVLVYSTYLGGSGGVDGAYGIAVDSSGDAYVVGITDSTDFPIVGTSLAPAPNGNEVAFVSKFNSTGTALIYSTYLGGNGGDWGSGIALDANGSAYVVGQTGSSNFPVTSNAYQTSLGSGASQNAFVSKLSADGQSLLYSTYLGGGGYDQGIGIALDANQNAYVTGYTTSGSPNPFPTTANAFQSTLHSTYGNGFISRIDTTKSGSSSLVYSTFLGGSGNWDQTNGIAVDANQNVYVGGMTSSSDFPLTASAYQTAVDTYNGTGFLTQIDTTKSGSAGLIYSTAIEGEVYAAGVALDSYGKVYATAGYIAKFDTTKSGAASLLYFTRVGGSSDAFTYSVAVDPNGDSYVSGWTWSRDLPVTSDAIQSTLGSSGQDAFVTALSANGSTVLFGTYLGGNGGSDDFASGIAVDANYNMYVSGFTQSSNFQTTSGAFQTSLNGAMDGFVLKFSPLKVPIVTSLSPATGIEGAAITISGENFGSSQGSSTVTFANGVTAQVTSWTATSVSVTVPSGATTGNVIVTVSGNPSNGATFSIVPNIVSLSPLLGGAGTPVTITGTGFGAIQGASTVTFNGTAAVPTSWSDTSIAVPVPTGATPGNVVVSVSSIASNGVYFGAGLIPGSGPWSNGYAHRRAITIDHTQVPNTDQANFPFLFSGNYSYLATTSNGGNVTNSNGYDVIFTSDPAGVTTLPFEQESYNASTGAVTYWIQIPILSHTTDTVIYMFYGNSGITTDQSNKTAVWDSNYALVSHLSDNAASTSVADSTSNANNLTNQANTSTKTTTGKISGGLTYNGSSDYSSVPNNSSLNIQGTTITLEVWVKPTNTAASSSERLIVKEVPSNANPYVCYGLFRASSGSSQVTFWVSTGGSGSYTSVTGGTMSAGQWMHIVGVYNGSTMTLYVDGSSVATASKTGNIASSSTPLVLGADTAASAEYFNGVLDEARISNNARSADWIAAEYANQDSPSTFYAVGFADFSNGYTHRNAITISHTIVPNTDQANFPVLISGTYSYLATTGNGGSVTNSSGYDIVFTSDASGMNPLAYERESYNSSTGAIIFWVKVPTLSHATDTTIYMFNGNSSVTTDQSNKTAVWDSNYALVSHLSDNAANTSVLDSTSNANTGTNSANTSTKSVPGEIGNALAYARASSDTTTFADSSSLEVTSAVSFEGWIKSSDTNGSNLWRSYQNSSPYTGYGFGYGVITSGKMSYWSSSHSSWVTANSTVNDGTWHHIAVTVSSGGGVSFYRDGVADGTQTSNVPPLYTGGKAIADGGFTGSLDEIRLSKTTRSADWIATEYNNQSSPPSSYGVGASTVTPAITGMSPNSGSVGTLVTIIGTNFGATQGSNTVAFNGVTGNPTSWSNTQIIVSVPGGALTGNVVVSVANLNSNAVAFTDTSAGIQTLSPSSGSIGIPVTITGANFGTTQGSSTVTFNGTTAIPTSWSNTQIVVTVPSGTSSGNVVVTVSGTASNGVYFAFTVPAISTLSPTSGPTGTSVTVSGSNFGATQGLSTVTIDGISSTPTSWSATSIVAPVPAAADTGNVVVTVGIETSNGVSFSVVPNITSVSPPSALTGIPVTITGTGFGATQGSSTVTFNGTAATPIFWSNTSIIVPVPNGTAKGNVVVTVGGLSSVGASFTVLPSGWLDQDVGAVGLTGSATFSNGTFTVNGAGYQVYNSSTDSMHFVYQTLSGDGTIVARVVSASNVLDAGVMIRETLNSNATSALMAFQGGPSIMFEYRATTGGSNNYSYASGVLNVPYWVKVVRAGNTFSGYASLDGVNWYLVGNSQTISMATNVYLGLDVNSGSTSTLGTATFDYVSVNSAATIAPTITGVSATTGPVGTQVTITGTGFGATQVDSVVMLNGLGATVNSWSNTSIVITIPAGATSGPLSVLVGPTMNASNAAIFTVTSQPLPVGWLDQDVGNVGVAGSATYSTGTFTTYGSGVMQSTDSFHFVYQPLSGDGTIIARVVNTNPAGEPGLMIRETLAANSNYAATIYYENYFYFYDRTTVGANPQVQNSIFDSGLPHWLKLTRSGNTFSGYFSANGESWTQIAPSETVNMAQNVYVGLMVDGGGNTQGIFDNVSLNSSANPAPVITGLSATTGTIGTQVVISGSNFGGSQSTSLVFLNDLPMTVNSWSDTSITVTIASGAVTGYMDVAVAPGMNTSNPLIFTVTTQPLPSGWLDEDIGNVGSAGSAGYSSGTFTVNGSGNLGTTTDAFHFVYQTLSGDGAIVARLVNMSNGAGPGVMIRETLAANSTFASSMYSNDTGNFAFNYRTTTGANSSGQLAGFVSNVPYWVKLTRSGSTFTGYISLDGVYWTQVGTSVSITMAQNVYIGLNVDGLASFDNVSVTAGTPYLTPTITGISPTSGGIGALVTITGSNFGTTQGSSSVEFNGSPATSITSWSGTQIVAAVPSNASTGSVTVIANGIGSNRNFSFTIYNPVISSLSPPFGPAGGTVVINGSGFGASYTGSSVAFNGVNAGYNTANWSDTSITATVPGSATSGPVTVTVSGVTSPGVQFSVIEAATITGLSPASGPTGTSVVITGTGFGPSQNDSTLTFYGAAPTNITNWSDTSITATVPAGAVTGPVSITVAGITTTGPVFTLTLSSTLTDSLGNTTTYGSEIVGGHFVSVDTQGSACSTCTVRGNTTNTFDSRGNILTTTDPAGHVVTNTYDSSSNLLTQSVQLNSTTSATTTYTYNSLGEVLTVTDPLGNVTTNAYDAHGNLTSVTSPKPNSGTAASVTTFAYNSLGELTTITDPLSHATTMTYTPAGLIATITDAQNNVTTYAYDAKGNRTSVTDALSHTTTFAYDSMSRLTTITYPDSSTSTFTYDIRGRRTSVTDQNGKTTSYAYDDADRLTSVTDAASHVTNYAYDTEDNLISITDANSNQTAFTYDAFGRVTNTNFPSSLSEYYQYDADNNLTQKTDRKGQTIQYLYDALNRLTQKTYPDTTAVDYTYDLVGKILQVNDPTGTYAFAYDNMGRLIGTTTSYSFLTSRNFTNAYTYDAGSNRTGFTDPESGSTAYSYDTLNRLTSLAPPSAFGSGSFGFTYDALSRRTQMTRPNSVTTSYTYDNLSRLLSVLHQLSGSTIDGASYTLDSAGNRTSKTDQLAGVTSNYTYDPIYQLTQVTQANNTTESYSYDAVGNRTASLGVFSYTTNASNELTATSNASYTYDSNGNTLTKVVGSNTTTFAWDYENRLTSVTLPGSGGTVTFKYDPLGRRIEKSSSGATSIFAYEGDNLIEEANSSGAVVARYSQTGNIDEPLATLRSSTTSYFEQDGLDSVTSLSNGAGALAQTYTFDSFGNQTASSGSLTNPFRYTGREFDSESGLYFMRERYFDPATGRFLNEDPTAFNGGINFYRYASNDPANLIDPFGLNPYAPAIPFPWTWNPGGVLEGVGNFIGVAGRAIGIGVTVVLELTVYAKPTAIDDSRAIPKPTPPCDKNKHDCAKEWADAYEMCRELLARPHPPRAMTGGYTDLANCARGLVSEECGGNPVGGKK